MRGTEFGTAADVTQAFKGDFEAEQPAPTGVLEKTWDSYLTRESSDITGLPDYATSDWSAEIAIDAVNSAMRIVILMPESTRKSKKKVLRKNYFIPS